MILHIVQNNNTWEIRFLKHRLSYNVFQHIFNEVKYILKVGKYGIQ